MKEFLAAMDAEERRLVELIGFLEAGVIATRPPAPPVADDAAFLEGAPAADASTPFVPAAGFRAPLLPLWLRPAIVALVATAHVAALATLSYVRSAPPAAVETIEATVIAAGDENNLNIRVYGTQASLEWHQEHPNELVVKFPDKPRQVWRRGNGYVGEAPKLSAKDATAGLLRDLP